MSITNNIIEIKDSNCDRWFVQYCVLYLQGGVWQGVVDDIVEAYLWFDGDTVTKAIDKRSIDLRRLHQ